MSGPAVDCVPSGSLIEFPDSHDSPAISSDAACLPSTLACWKQKTGICHFQNLARPGYPSIDTVHRSFNSIFHAQIEPLLITLVS